MNRLNTILYWLVSQGSHDAASERQQQEIKFVNTEALIVFFLCFPAVPVCYFAFPDKSHYAVLFFLFVPFFFTLLLNKWHLLDYARINILLTAEISLFGAVSIFGKECNLQYIFIIIIFAGVITFQNNGKKSLIFILGVAAVLLYCIYASDLSLFQKEQLTPFQTEIIKVTGLLLCLLSSVVIAFFYVSKFNAQRQTIEKHNRELEYQKMEIERQNTVLNQKSIMIECANAELQEKNLALEQLNLEKNEFLGIAAHDLKNPLTGITITTMVLQQYFSKFSTEQVIERVKEIHESAERMTSIIMTLLDFNAIESGKLNLNVAMCDISSIATKTLTEYKERASEKRISLHGIIPPDIQGIADKVALSQVLDNLVSNAIKFSPEGKNVYLQLTTQATHENHDTLPIASSHTARVRISVLDEGPGMTEDDKSKLFGRYTKLSARPTAGEHSTGLGLSIVKRLVEAMYGRVWCESELGKGAEFIVELRAQ